MSASIANSDTALKLLLAFLPKAESDLLVDYVADQLSQLQLDGQKVEGTNSIAYLVAEKYNSDLSGKTDTEKAEISQWMSMSARHGPSERQVFSQTINEHLAGRTFLVSNYLSLADLVAFSNVHAFMESLSTQKRFNWSNFSRWFDLVQHTVPTEAISKVGLKLVDIDLDAPAPSKKQPNASTEKGKSGAGDETTKKDKKDKHDGQAKKEKPKKQQQQQQQPAKEELEIAPSLIDLRVGHIIKVEKHPDADALYVEDIEVGEPEPRKVVSGLVRFISIENMNNRDVVLVCNLKPAAMRGVKSYAMVLCATSPDGNAVEFVEPPKGSKPGDRVYFEGFEDQEPMDLLKPKLKIFETIQPGLFTNDNHEAGWYDADKKFHKLLVGGSICTTATIANGSLK